MKKCAIIMSHNATEAQIKDLRVNFDAEVVVVAPADIKSAWGQIDPNLDTNGVWASLQPILEWLAAVRPDYVWCQGEMTAVAVIWQWCRTSGTIPLVATTRRVVEEVTSPNGEVTKTAVFKHVRFRDIPL